MLSFLECEDNPDKEFQSLITFIDNFKIVEFKEKFQEFLLLILKIADNHHRHSHFFNRIDQIILHLSNDIKQSFSNFDICKMFINNPRILLSFLHKQIIMFDKLILEYYDVSFFYFFFPEIENLLDDKTRNKLKEKFLQNDPNFFATFEEKRKIGENDSYLCSLIRSDSIVEFISYVNRSNLSLSDTTIPNSIFETNSFLKKKNPTLIEYSAFFGSIQIFQYLRMNKVELTPSLWKYAIHSQSAEMINILEENKVNFERDFIKQSIKCHHNDITKYIEDNYITKEDDQEEDDENEFKITLIRYGFRYSNFNFIPENICENKFAFFYLCDYNHPLFSSLYLKMKKIDPSIIIDFIDYMSICIVKPILFGELSSAIYKIEEKRTGKHFSLCSLNYAYESDFSTFYRLINIEQFLQIQYPALACVKGYFTRDKSENHRFSLLFDYYDKETLIQYLQKKEKTDTRNYILILGIAIALNHLQSRNIIHYLLSPDVIYIDENYYPHVSEFCISGESLTDYFIQRNISDKWIYQPPEFLDSNDETNFNEYSNVYSYSLIVSHILTGIKPFKCIKKNINTFSKPYSSTNVCPEIRKLSNDYIADFLETCWSIDPLNRYFSFNDILQIITNKEFYSFFPNLDISQVKKYLDIFGNEFSNLKNNF